MRKEGEKTMKIDTMKIVKIAVTVAGVGITLAQGYFADKDLDKKVAEKVAEALENK